MKWIFVSAAMLPLMSAMGAEPPASTSPSAAGSPPQSQEAGRAAVAAKAKTSQGFVASVAQSLQLQQQASLLAMTKAADQSVRTLAQRSLDDYEKLRDGLRAAAAKKRLAVPTQPDADTKSKLDALRAKQGQQFDQLYLAAMAAAHDEQVSLFRHAASASGIEAPFKLYARKSLPLIEQQVASKQDPAPMQKPKPH